MIRQISSAAELEAAARQLVPDIFGAKILTLADSYSFSYPFARFFDAEKALICDYYGAGVLWGEADAECAEFAAAADFGELLMSRVNYEKAFLGQPAAVNPVMSRSSGGESADRAALRTDTPYEQVFDILKDGFDIRFEDWYPDACHMVRHGISTVYTLGESALQRMFTKNGMTLFSLVAVKNGRRGEGLGKRLVCAAAADCPESRIYIICEPHLCGFYKSCGFVPDGEAAAVYFNNRKEIQT